MQVLLLFLIILGLGCLLGSTLFIVGTSHILMLLTGQQYLSRDRFGCFWQIPILIGVGIFGWLFSIPFYQVSFPAEMPASGPYSPDPGMLITLFIEYVLPLVKNLIFGLLVASVVRYGLLVRHWGKALTGAVMVALPMLGFLVGAQITRVYDVEVWHPLGTPPEPALRIVGVDFASISVKTTDEAVYSCCTANGRWQAGGFWNPYNRDVGPVELNLATPTLFEGEWKCADCFHDFNGVTTPSEISAPPIPLAQPTMFRAIRTCWASFGGVGIANDGRVWEWRRFTQINNCAPPQTWYLTPHSVGQVVQGAILGSLIGIVVSTFFAFFLRHRRATFATRG